MNNGIILDFERRERCGVEEAIYCEGKSSSQIESIIRMAIRSEKRLLLTRLSESKFRELSDELQSQRWRDSVGRTAIWGEVEKTQTSSQVVIVSGGASDAAVCKEIVSTLIYHRINCKCIEDVGVSALWRLNNHIDIIKEAKIVIAVAGMEAALPTVLAGMISNPIIAVPTSVGYGVSKGGHLALQACLGSCASGLTTVNIDNGFGAACAAIKLLNHFKLS